jgi:effector-binding domain-containing protein
MMAYTCTLEHTESQPVLSIHARTPISGLPDLMEQSFGSVAQYLSELGEAPSGPPFVVYNTWDLRDLDVELGFPVDNALPGRGDIQSHEFSAGWQASVIYTGPYPKIGPAYEALNEFIKSKGRQSTGVAIEYYLNSPEDTPADALQTLIVLPLEP